MAGVRTCVQPLLLLLLLVILASDTCGTPAPSYSPTSDALSSSHSWNEPTESVPAYNKPVAQSPDKTRVAQPVISISERVQSGPREKKDLGALGYVLGILMVVIIIAIGSGIMVGYIYKRGRDLKQRHEEELKEQRLHRINLPLSAFLNPTCDIVDENNIEVASNHTPNTAQEGVAPLMGCAGTPGA